MTTGPKPRPGEQSALLGNPGHRPVVTTPDTVPQLDDAPPDWMEAPRPRTIGRGRSAVKIHGTDPRQIWAALMPSLRALRFVKSTDRNALGRYCTHIARWIDLSRILDAKGSTYVTQSNHGTLDRIRPEANLILRLETVLTQLEDRLGLTPAARQSLIVRLADLRGADPAASGAASSSSVARPNDDMPLSPLGLLANLHPEGRSN